MSNPMSGGDGTVETMAEHNRQIEAAGIAERERIEAQMLTSRANRDAYHSTDAETVFLEDLAQRGIHVHSDQGRTEIAQFRTGTHPSQTQE